MKKLRYELEGKAWLPIGRAAKMLRTNAMQVRVMMGDGRLDWRQTRLNSRTFVVSEEQIVAMMRAGAKTPLIQKTISAPGAVR